MITIRPANERGHANHGWLDTHFSFSFADYYDPNHMGFRSLRVINDDRVAGGAGFPMHPHRDMEIITYMLEGALAHKDSMGHGATVSTGEVQRMTAGKGILHSEFNPSQAESAHLLQIWLLPRARGLDPSYEQKLFPAEQKRDRLALIASPDGHEGSLRIEQDVSLYASQLQEGASVSHSLEPGRHAWIQVARGELNLNGIALKEGDGAAISDEQSLSIRSTAGAEFLLFDLN